VRRTTLIVDVCVCVCVVLSVVRQCRDVIEHISDFRSRAVTRPTSGSGLCRGRCRVASDVTSRDLQSAPVTLNALDCCLWLTWIMTRR